MIHLTDIAKAVNLDISVVSRALSPRPDRHAVIRDETRDIIRRTAQRMGYRPNRQASFLKKGRSATILCFLPGIPNRLYADLVFGISEKACCENFPVNFFFSDRSREFGGFLDQANAIGHCGIISYPPVKMAETMRRELDGYRDGGGNILLLNVLSNSQGGRIPEAYRDIPQLNIDDHHGGRLAARHLAERGCRALYYWRSRAHYADRYEGFASEAAARGLPQADLAAGGIPDLLRRKERVGVFAASDFDAFSLMFLLRDGGVAAGDRVLVVGFDDMVESAVFQPSLTTVHQPTRREGALAVEKLIRMIFGERETGERLKPHLVIRESTGGSRPDPDDDPSTECVLE